MSRFVELQNDKRTTHSFLLVVYISILVFSICWGYSHFFWTKSDLTLTPTSEQAQFDAFGLYFSVKVVHDEHIHPREVVETLWGPLPYYLYAAGVEIFGERLSSIREVVAFFSGIWGAIIFLIIYASTKRPVFSFFAALLFIPFAGHTNFHANRGYAHFYTFLLQAASMFMMLLYVNKRKIRFLVLIGLIQGISFAFKYELSLLGLLAAFMALYILETVDAHNNAVREKKRKLLASNEKQYLRLKIIKLLPLFLVFLYTIYLTRLGFLPHVMIVFWAACLVILFLELKLIWAFWREPFRIDNGTVTLAKNISVVLIPFLLMVLFWFLHLWQMTDFQVAKDYFMQIMNTSSQITRMQLSSPAISAHNLRYFVRGHPISFAIIARWCFCLSLLYWALFFLRNIFIKGIAIGFVIYLLFKAFNINQVELLSMYYFIAIISVFLWAYLFNVIRKSKIKDLPLEFIVYLCFLAAGSLALLRETVSFDLNIWPMFPPLIGCLTFMLYSPAFSKRINWIKTVCLASIFYFLAMCWFQVEAINMIYSSSMNAGVGAVDEEFDLLMPKNTAIALQEMKKHFQENLGEGEHIFIFSDHLYPYMFAPNGAPTKYLMSFQTPDKQKEKRMLSLFKEKNIKYVLISHGMNAYHTKRAAEMFPELHAYISRNYAQTGKRFLNFEMCQAINRR